MLFWIWQNNFLPEILAQDKDTLQTTSKGIENVFLEHI